jgi:NitT/TauT family transport system permease protein
MKQKRLLWTGLGVLFLLLLWSLGALLFNSELILPKPFSVLMQLVALIPTASFGQALGMSFLRVCLGIVMAAPLGVAAGLLAGLKPGAAAFMQPGLALVSSTPVMALILILFLWFGSEGTPIAAAFLIIFPLMASNATAGVKALDGGLKEVCLIYGLSRKDKLRYFYIPGILPFILGGLRSSLSLSWKVVAAAEIMVQPLRALGTGMQRARAQLETPELFAWTAATVIAAALSQALINLALKKRKQ